MDPFESVPELEAYLEKQTGGVAGDTIAIARAQPLVLRRLERAIALLKKPSEGQRGFRRKKPAWDSARSKLDEDCWVRLYGPGDPEADNSQYKYIVAWR